MPPGDNDKILYFPGFEPGGKGPLRQAEPPPLRDLVGPPEDGVGPPPEVEKALSIILSGTPFVIVGVRPTPGGADFLSSAYGDPSVLAAARGHLADMQDRALARYLK